MQQISIEQIHDVRASRSLGAYLNKFSTLYPNIGAWFERVRHDVPEGRRAIYIASTGVDVRGAAIVKHGTVGKLCHLSVDSSVSGFGLAHSLATLAIRELHENGSQDIIVTTSEPTFYRYGGFFSRLGFETSDWHCDRYLKGVTEIIWAARSANLLDRLYDNRGTWSMVDRVRIREVWQRTTLRSNSAMSDDGFPLRTMRK